MTDRRPPVDALSDFLDDLAEDLFSLSDEELRAELLEDSESLDNYSARFQAAFRAADSRLRAQQSRRDEDRIAARLAAEPIAVAETASGINEIHDPYGGAKWGPRPVRHYAGPIEALLDRLPTFELAPFRASPAMEEHPDLMLVVRKPTPKMPEIAVGAVSRKYALVQHGDAVRMCLRGLKRALASAELEPSDLRGELTLSEFGEWMDFTFVLPDEYSFEDTYGHKAQFRCDVSNSVDGSSRLDVRFDWFREVCSNGMIVPEQMRESRMHRSGLQLYDVERRVFKGFAVAERDRETLEVWQRTPTSWQALKDWVDSDLRQAWHDHAAARVCHICLCGEDTNRFRRVSGGPSARAIRQLQTFDDESRPVPGSPHQATTKYDVAQAMSWVASRRTNVVERVRWQRQIPALLDRLQAA